MKPNWGYINKDKPVKQIKVTKEYKDLKLETLYVETYEMHLTLTNEQHKKIEALWDLKDLPNPIIVSGYATPKEHYNYPEVWSDFSLEVVDKTLVNNLNNKGRYPI